MRVEELTDRMEGALHSTARRVGNLSCAGRNKKCFRRTYSSTAATVTVRK